MYKPFIKVTSLTSDEETLIPISSILHIDPVSVPEGIPGMSEYRADITLIDGTRIEVREDVILQMSMCDLVNDPNGE